MTYQSAKTAVPQETIIGNFSPETRHYAMAVKCLGAFLFLALFLPLTAPVEAATLMVINTNDGGTGSLRQAIIDANAASGADLINFNVPGAGVRTINLMSPLPPITEALTIDGYSQPGSSVNTIAIGDNAVLLIELNGANAGGGGLDTQATSTIRGLVVGSFLDLGIVIRASAPGSVITGCFIGTDPTGMFPRPNFSGNIVSFSSSNVIGGITPDLRNIVSSNSLSDAPNGIELDGDQANPTKITGNVIQGNYIGVNAAGTAALGNGAGISVLAQTNLTIGGASAGARNVISGNTSGGIEINFGVSNSSILGNYIGLDANGQAKVKNQSGIFLGTGSNNLTIGGPNAGQGNVIAGNQSNGIDMFPSAHDNLIQGNLIGTDRTGTVALGNGNFGLNVAGTFNQVGGAGSSASRNVISGSGGAGIKLGGDHNTLLGNFIGTDLTGTKALPNNGPGIYMPGAGANTIGDTSTGGFNLVSGNLQQGIYIQSSSGDTVKGNRIGTDITGGPLGNGAEGILIENSTDCFIGDLSGGGNTIAFNKWGVRVTTASQRNMIVNNSIFANDGGPGQAWLGIDLNTDDVTPNDLGDGDNGANGLLNFPVITSAITSGATASVTGTLNSAPNAQFSVSLFSNSACDPSGFGEGENVLGVLTVTTNAAGDAAFSTSVNAQAGQFITATATDASGNTSEFSQCRQIIVPGSSGALQLSAGTYTVNENGGQATITVTRTGGSIGAVSIQYATSNGTALAGSDYTSASGTLNWANGDAASKTFVVPIINDSRNEANEALDLILTNPVGGAVLGGPSSAVLTIIDDDPAPSLSISDVSKAEGNNGTMSLNFTVTLSATSGQAVTVDYTTADGTAQAGADYQSTSGSLFFNPGQNSKQISVLVNGDTQVEANETFFVNLSSPANATVSKSQGIGTILDDDGALSAGTLQFGAATFSVNENGGPATITVSRTSGNSGAVSVQYAIIAGGTASAGSDYTAGSGTLNWADGDPANKTFTVAITDDSLSESNETVNLSLSNPTGGAALGNPSGATLTIVDNDALPSLSISDVSQAEGNNGTANFDFNVTLSVVSGQTIAVKYATTAGTATLGSDYQAVNGTITFAPGETSKPLTLLINGDSQVEPDETFFINLSNPVNATIVKAQGVGTIINDDSVTPATLDFSKANYSVQEDLGALTVTITRSGDTNGSSSVDYTTFDGTATQRADFEYAAGTINFAPGDTSKTLQVLINEDMYLEGNETFTLTLSNPGGGVLGSQSSTVIAINDDSPETLTNPIDDNQNFVYMQYHDFLNREPDAAGLAFWTSDLAACGNDQSCLSARRSDVSAAFFLSIEFQETGYLVYRMYKASYGNLPGMPVPVRFAEFTPDREEISRGVVVNQAGWEQLLENNKQAFAAEFVQRAQFTSTFPASLTPAQFVDAMFANGTVVPSASERQLTIDEFGGAPTAGDVAARARALRRVAENLPLAQQEFNSAFVLMQYFGYLRRDPNTTPEPTLDYQGYNFWLSKLNQFNGNYSSAEMVKAFLTSTEYRQRFGP
jgi:hypothetical protein